MYAQVEKQKENSFSTKRQESRAFANSVSQKKSAMKQGLGFVDNRPETIMQKRLIKRDLLPREDQSQRILFKSTQSTPVVQRRLMVNRGMLNRVLAVMENSANAHFYNNMVPDQNFTLKITYGGISDEPKQLGLTTGSATSMDENYEEIETDLKKKTNAERLNHRVTNLRKHVDDIASSVTQEVHVRIYDRYFQGANESREEKAIGEFSQLATLIHELDLHVVPAYKLVAWSKGEAVLKQSDELSVEDQELLKEVREDLLQMLSQDEHSDEHRIVNMINTVYNVAGKMPPNKGLALLRAVQNDIYTLPGFSKQRMSFLERLGWQRTQI